MSYIAAVGAKNKANAFINNSYKPVDTVSQAMTANAAKDIASTKNEAQRDYFGRIGEAKMDSIAKIGAAQSSAADKAFMGEMFGTIGSAAMGVSKFGAGAGWFDKGPGLGSAADSSWNMGFDSAATGVSNEDIAFMSNGSSDAQAYADQITSGGAWSWST